MPFHGVNAVKSEISNNRFVIAGGRPGLKICWLVTGIRNDAYAQEHPFVVEQEKGFGNKYIKGTYIHAKEFGLPLQRSFTYQTDKVYRAEVDESDQGLVTFSDVRLSDLSN